jgi:signal peptidase I
VTAAGAPAHPIAGAGRVRWRKATLELAAQGLAFGVVPALGAFVVLRFLVPTADAGLPGLVARLALGSPLPFGAALFLVLSAIARYWWTRLYRARSKAALIQAPSRRKELAGVAAAVVLAASAAGAVRSYGARPYRVAGESMLPTLEPGDIVAGRVRSRLAEPLRGRGDIVVFHAPASAGAASWSTGEALVKRVVGLAGDRLGMQGGTPTINGWPVPSCDAGDYLYVVSNGRERAVHGRLRVEFLDDHAYLTVHAQTLPSPQTFRVEPGEVFVLGDDRASSIDSRAYGGIRLREIESRIDRFLVGTHRSGNADFARVLHPIDALQLNLHLEGVATDALEEGIARCLAQRPSETHPPPPDPF